MQDKRFNEDVRRVFWVDQMEAAYAFMMKMLDCPVEECGEPLVSLVDAVDDGDVEVMFAETKLANVYGRIFFMREGLVENFVAAAREMNNRGWILKVEDCYRSMAMQRELSCTEIVFDVILERIIWELKGCVPSADIMLRRLTALTATFPKVATHMSGSAMDISVLSRDDGVAIDRGGPYLELSELTPMESPFISAEAHQNRMEITELMAGHGFTAYPYEFWHYSSKDAYAEYLGKSGKLGRYGAVEMIDDAGNIQPIAKAKEPLHSMEEILSRIEIAIRKPTDRSEG